MAVAVALVGLGVLACAARLDTPADGTVLDLGRSTWTADGVVVTVLPGQPAGGLRSGDEVTAIDGVRLADGIGGLAPPRAGQFLEYTVVRDAAPDLARTVRAARPEPGVLVRAGWGDLVFVLALALLAAVLHLRRPDEPATAPLLVAAAGLLGSTGTVVLGLPAVALATGGPQLWLFHANVVGAYSLAWGAVLAMTLLFVPDHPWLSRHRRRVLVAAYAGPLVGMAAWAGVLAVAVGDPIARLGLLETGQTAVSAGTLLVGVVAGVIGYRRSADPQTRARLRWVVGGGAVSVAVGILGWSLPELVTGRFPVPPGAFGLSGLPFVAGIGIALRRHRLFDLDRLVNRSVVYAAVVAVLVAAYAGTVAVLAGGLHLSGALAAALGAVVAALALAPLRVAAQGAVNRLMYGQRDDPAGVLAGLGRRLQSTVRADDVPATVVETVARSLRIPFAAVDLADEDGGFRVVAQHGEPVGEEHVEDLVHLGEAVGRLRVCGRSADDPLDAVDLALIRSLGQQAGPAVLALRLHHDVLRSRAEVVALREDERRRLRRELHDGLGPSLAAIALKADLAARTVPDGAALTLLGEIGDEVRAGIADIRRVVDTLRPPALDELGLVGAVAARAGSLSGDMALEVCGPVERAVLPAAVETAAYRIAVEAMTNAVRHSGGRRCAVGVDVGTADVVVTVRDDGAGLPEQRRAGVGLRSMRERAVELGGTCRVEPADGGGTLVEARLPLDGGVPR